MESKMLTFDRGTHYENGNGLEYASMTTLWNPNFSGEVHPTSYLCGPPKPLWNSATEDILNKVIVTSAKMRHGGHPPTTVVLNPRDYYTVLTRCNISFDPYKQEIANEADFEGCSLFGMKLVKGTKSLLKSDFYEKELIIRAPNGLTIIIKSRANPFKGGTREEIKAIETLREMISEADYRRFLKYGFILVRARSGKIYQIPRVNKHIKVWHNGQVVEELCSYINDEKIPPTDRLVAFKTMLESDNGEEELRKISNVYRLKAA